MSQLGQVSLDLGNIITGLIGALLIYFVKENTSEKKETKAAVQLLREQVLVLQTQLEPIKNAVNITPVLVKSQEKLEEDLQEYFSEVKKIKGLLSDKGFALK